MREPLHNMKECFVYPGGYIPMPETETIVEEVKTSLKDIVAKPFVNMNELADGYQVEVVVPGVRREDFFIFIHNHVLSIVVQHKDCETSAIKNLQIHEFDAACFERHIILPDDADTEFISAEYKDGILRMHLPKTEEVYPANMNRVVVY